jgi:hypothetical protein
MTDIFKNLFIGTDQEGYFTIASGEEQAER